MRLDGQTAFLTGGGRGIGAVVARAFAGAGANLVLLARTRSEIDRGARELAGQGVRTLAIPTDVSKRAQVERAVTAAIEEFGRIDVLINAAGIYGPIGPLVENDLDAWTRAVEVNLLGTLHCMHFVLPGMIARGRGVVINFSGGGAASPFPRFSAYSATKAAVVRLTETVAQEVKVAGIRINAIAPGAVNTRMLDQVLAAGEKAGAEFYSRATEQKEKGGTPPERAAELALFLASPEAEGLTGRLISAVWDDWRSLPERARELKGSALFTMRRIDGRNFAEVR